ncbi:LacI family transcriptional regulator [Enterococcus sp. AZ194]|uniref:LacI family DNA-binding transcriptional regulator n=1 Tax=Enterococcus sp. AZ194 TaxID=2774629 RepID=UPI003F260638
MVTLKEIAEHSGYSQATVSRLFKGDNSLSITNETKQKIIHTALSMGYDRSKIKTTLEKIAVLFWLTEQEELQDVYFQQLRLSLEKYAQLSNMEIELIKHEENTIQIPDSVSGFVGVGSFTSEELLMIKETCPNGVLLELNPEPDLFDTVKPDTDRITRQAIDYFVQKGYTKIGFIGGAFHNPMIDQDEADSREIAFRQYMDRKGLLNDSYIFSKGKFTVNQGYELTLELIKTLGDDLPEAFFIASDTIAVGALQAFNEKYISIPDRIELISVNDTEISKFVSPPLTTFRIDVEEIAKTAIDMLVDQIVYPRKITKTVLLGSELVIRKSFQP